MILVPLSQNFDTLFFTGLIFISSNLTVHLLIISKPISSLFTRLRVGLKGKALKLYSVKTAFYNLPLTFMILELARMIGRKELKKDFNITNDSKLLEKRRNDSVDQYDI